MVGRIGGLLAAQLREKVGGVDGLCKDLELMALRTGFLEQVGCGGLAGEEQYFALGQALPSNNGGFNAGHASHNDVADEHVGLKAIERLDGLLSAEHCAGFKSCLIEDDRKGIGNHLFVICYEYSGF